MNGVSYMIPVVVGGGILMAIAVLLTGEGAAPGWGSGIPYWLWTIGVDALGLMCPVFAAYIAFSIADRLVLQLVWRPVFHRIIWQKSLMR